MRDRLLRHEDGVGTSRRSARLEVSAGFGFLLFHTPGEAMQATRLRKGMLIKMGEDLFRVLELQHVTPGN
jgi:hypothetical protein